MGPLPHMTDAGRRDGYGYEYWPLTAKSTMLPLGQAPRGFRGRIHAVHAAVGKSGMSGEELERRLLELGFVEGATVELLHEGQFGRDPIAVRLNDSTIALRRSEANAVLVTADGIV